MSKCFSCGVELTQENWLPSDQKHNNHQCYPCKNRRLRDWRRRRCITLKDGRKRVIGNKRPFPSNSSCELCGKKPPRMLAYHHYDDFHVAEGLWVCQPCHMFIERVDRGYLAQYLRLKQQIRHIHITLKFDGKLLVEKISSFSPEMDALG